MKEVQLPSGAVLKIGTIPFEDANNLKKAVMREIKGVPIKNSKETMDLYKDYLCSAFGSEEVEKALWECMKRCIYNSGLGDLKIDLSTFQNVQAREDFTTVQVEVGIESLAPFGKSLWQLLLRMVAFTEGAIPQ
jgi:hypothetical protein